MAAKTDKRKSLKRGIFYWKKNVPYLGVTSILQILDKPALRYWYGQEVYYAMLKDPTLQEREALAAPYKAGKKAQGRGSTVHSIVEAYKESGVRMKGIAPEYQGFADAFYLSEDELKPEIIEQEKTVFDEELKLGGTLDRYCKIDGKFYVIDYKTGKQIYPEVDLQLSAYAKMLRDEGKPVDGIGVILLEIGQDKKPTGNYQWAPRTENYAAFLHAKELYEWMHRGKLIKQGYLKA